MTATEYPYKFDFVGEKGIYHLQVSADTNLFRLILPDKKYLSGSSIAIINNPESNELKNIENGLIIQWIIDVLFSFEYRIYKK